MLVKESSTGRCPRGLNPLPHSVPLYFRSSGGLRSEHRSLVLHPLKLFPLPSSFFPPHPRAGNSKLFLLLCPIFLPLKNTGLLAKMSVCSRTLEHSGKVPDMPKGKKRKTLKSIISVKVKYQPSDLGGGGSPGE